MRAVGIVGRSGSGKTTLIERLLPLFREEGFSVSTVKRTHHSVDLDPPGKDSRRHRDAGAEEVLLVGERRWALLRETAQAPPLSSLLSRMAPVDLVLVEGFGDAAGPRLELVRAALAGQAGKRPLFHHDPAIAAVAADAPVPGWRGTLLDLDDPRSICAWIASVAGLPSPRSHGRP